MDPTDQPVFGIIDLYGLGLRARRNRHEKRAGLELTSNRQGTSLFPRYASR
jgi:hypothetical protein